MKLGGYGSSCRTLPTLEYCLIVGVLCIVSVCGEQSFFTKPNETSVIAGQMAILNCVILDKVGPLQWTKDGFSMGKTSSECVVFVRPSCLQRLWEYERI